MKRRHVLTERASGVTSEPNEGALFVGKYSTTYILKSAVVVISVEGGFLRRMEMFLLLVIVFPVNRHQNRQVMLPCTMAPKHLSFHGLSWTLICVFDIVNLKFMCRKCQYDNMGKKSTQVGTSQVSWHLPGQ